MWSNFFKCKTYGAVCFCWKRKSNMWNKVPSSRSTSAYKQGLLLTNNPALNLESKTSNVSNPQSRSPAQCPTQCSPLKTEAFNPAPEIDPQTMSLDLKILSSRVHPNTLQSLHPISRSQISSLKPLAGIVEFTHFKS